MIEFSKLEGVDMTTGKGKPAFFVTHVLNFRFDKKEQ